MIANVQKVFCKIGCFWRKFGAEFVAFWVCRGLGTGGKGGETVKGRNAACALSGALFATDSNREECAEKISETVAPIKESIVEWEE